MAPVLLIVIFKYFKKRALSILKICRFWQMAVGGILRYLNLQIRNSMVNNALPIVV
jgi:hypothetical protein